MKQADDATYSRPGHPAHQRHRTALIVFAVIAALVMIGALHLLGANPHAAGFGLVMGMLGMVAGFSGAVLGGLEMGDTPGIAATALWVCC